MQIWLQASGFSHSSMSMERNMAQRQRSKQSYRDAHKAICVWSVRNKRITCSVSSTTHLSQKVPFKWRLILSRIYMAKSFNRLAFKCIRSIFLHIFISYDLLDWILLFISLVHCTDVLPLQACLGQQRDSVTGGTFKHLKPNKTLNQQANIMGNACLPANPQHREKINTNLISLRSGFGMCLVKFNTKTWRRKSASLALSNVNKSFFKQLQDCLSYALYIVNLSDKSNLTYMILF